MVVGKREHTCCGKTEDNVRRTPVPWWCVGLMLASAAMLLALVALEAL